MTLLHPVPRCFRGNYGFNSATCRVVRQYPIDYAPCSSQTLGRKLRGTCSSNVRFNVPGKLETLMHCIGLFAQFRGNTNNEGRSRGERDEMLLRTELSTYLEEGGFAGTSASTALHCTVL